MRHVLVACALALALYALPARAVPYGGCTLMSDEFWSDSWSCAAFKIGSIGSCYGTRHIGPITYEEPRFLFEGWFPQFFIEVQTDPGHSIFATSDAPLIRNQMQRAAGLWTDPGTGGTDATQTRSDMSILHGRMLPIPNDAVWNFEHLNFRPGVPVAAAACMLAISEYVPATWGDHPTDSGDRLLATAWAPVTAPVCTIAGGVIATIARLPLTFPSEWVRMMPCAVPIPTSQQRWQAMTGPSAYNPAAQCMGALGGLLPRTGWTDGDQFHAAQRVAWRTASLASDLFRTGGGVEGQDKWQMVRPRALSHRCFAPGSLLRPGPPPVDFTGAGTLLRASDEPYVFAVWRYARSCVKVEDLPAVELEMNSYPLRPYGCRMLNAVVGGL